MGRDPSIGEGLSVYSLNGVQIEQCEFPTMIVIGDSIRQCL